VSRFFGSLLAIFGRNRWSVVEEYQGAPKLLNQADLTTYMERFEGSASTEVG
jgi:hypothetical protein